MSTSKPVVKVKDGVKFTVISPAGMRMLAALDFAAAHCNHDVTVTSACDGRHSGPLDPHKRGEAYDIRTNDLATPEAKALLLEVIMTFLGTDLFYGFIEDPAPNPNEHIHVQLRHGMVYPPPSV